MVVIESIGWKHLLGVALIVTTIAIVVVRRDQIHSRMIIAIVLMSLGSVLTGASSILHLGLGFVDLELAALVSWTAALVLALVTLRHRDGNEDTL